jgi:hypothetical protein
MRMGAEIPRYSLENLPCVSWEAIEVCMDSIAPFISDNLSEAVNHVVVAVLANGRTGLKLSIYV